MVKIYTNNLNYHTPLYKKYQGQNNPQPAYLEIFPEGGALYDARFDWSEEIGNAIPESVWDNHVIRIGCQPKATGTALRALIKDENFLELINAVIKGHSLSPNGNDYIGHSDCCANEAIDTLVSILCDYALED